MLFKLLKLVFLLEVLLKTGPPNLGILYSYFDEKGCGKNVHATIPQGDMGYDQYTVPDTVAVEPTFVAFLQHWQTYIHGLSWCHSFKFL